MQRQNVREGLGNQVSGGGILRQPHKIWVNVVVGWSSQRNATLQCNNIVARESGGRIKEWYY